MKEAITDEYCIEAMQDELQQFERNDVWELGPIPDGVNKIKTKWVYRIKLMNTTASHGTRQDWSYKDTLK